MFPLILTVLDRGCSSPPFISPTRGYWYKGERPSLFRAHALVPSFDGRKRLSPECARDDPLSRVSGCPSLY